MFNTATDARRFIEAGRAIVTVKSHKSGEHMTFRFGKARNNDSIFFVSLKNSAIDRDQRYLGVYDAGKGEFRTTPKSQYRADRVEPRTVSYLVKKLSAGELPQDAEITHAGCCGRCGRMLTHPESIQSGYGPECIGKVREGKWYQG